MVGVPDHFRMDPDQCLQVVQPLVHLPADLQHILLLDLQHLSQLEAIVPAQDARSRVQRATGRRSIDFICFYGVEGTIDPQFIG